MPIVDKMDKELENRDLRIVQYADDRDILVIKSISGWQESDERGRDL